MCCPIRLRGPMTRPIASPSPFSTDVALAPVVRRQRERRQQLLLRHDAARVEPEAVKELGLLLRQLRVLPPPRRRSRERPGHGQTGS
eukprot:scaffold103335_cov60-Phaeocystis_antarctica.AAC.3